jgi:helix-turn-helix protein
MKKKIEKLTEKEKQLLVVAYILSGLKESGFISGALFETSSEGRSIVSEMIKGGYKLPVEVLPAAIEALIEQP